MLTYPKSNGTKRNTRFLLVSFREPCRLFRKTHDEWPESKSTTNCGYVSSTEKREKFESLNFKLLFVTFYLGAEVLTVFLINCRRLFTSRSKLRV